MSLYNSYDRTRFLDETNFPLDTQGGVLTPAQQKAAILANLGIAASGVGYAAGVGGTITQATSRTTGVTLNKLSGAITLFAAAGSSTPASFVVTDSAVGANDTISLSIKSATTNKYRAYVTAVAAGSFEITFEAASGTTSDSPVINFNVIKGVVA